MTDLDRLVAEFAAEYEAGSRPNPGKFLAKADAEERQLLADRLDAYLDTAPGRAWDPGAYERSAAKVAVDRVFESLQGEAGSWPELLPKLREQARILREDLTRRLAETLGFPAEHQRVHAYYHQMEHGQIPASGVSDKVLVALASILGTTPDRLRTAGERVSGGDVSITASFARQAFPDPEYHAEDALSAGPPAAAAVPRRAAESPGRPGRDELDELFLGPAG